MSTMSERGSYPKFSVFDAFCYKVLPSWVGCGADYLWAYKRAWVSYNKELIKIKSQESKISPLLLAGVAYTEVGGKDFTDIPVFLIRSYSYGLLPFSKQVLPASQRPYMTSMGPVSIQLRRVAETLGLNPEELSFIDLANLAISLQCDSKNLEIVSKHLRVLSDIDFKFCISGNNMDDEMIRVIGTRYWYGPERSTDFIKVEASKSDSYGTNILKKKSLLLKLLE